MEKQVYVAINKIQEEMASIGISKDRENQQQGYSFRGIDDVYGAIAPLLAKHKLVIIPRQVSRIVAKEPSKSGGVLFYVVVEVEYDMISSVDGSCHTARMPGEAMDSGDKATNKAMSAAYKYLCLQTFCIPTEGDNDTENHSHEVAHKPKAKTAQELTATGMVKDKGKANAGGYIPFTLDNQQMDDGKDIKFTTKTQNFIDILDNALENGNKVHITYSKTEYRGYCSIHSVIPVLKE